MARPLSQYRCHAEGRGSERCADAVRQTNETLPRPPAKRRVEKSKKRYRKNAGICSIKLNTLYGRANAIKQYNYKRSLVL